MFHIKFFSPLALVAAVLATVAAPATADAQQAYAYSNMFDDNTDLVLTSLWAVDNTPQVPSGAPASGGNNLNYNNGVDYSSAPAAGGTARTPTIDLTGVQSATMSFWCRYQTEETGVSYDRRYFRIYNANSPASPVYNAQLAGSGGQLTCPAMNQWHQHTFATMPAGTTNIPLILEFYFYPVDTGLNNYQGWFIDDLVIIADDVTPPDLIADLAASNPQITSIQLDWTAPFDDDISGVAATYDLRFATAPIDDTNFAQATQVSGEPSPGAPGTPHTVVVTGLNPGTAYYFAIQTTDVAGNTSSVSNVATLATLAPPAVGGSATTSAAPPKDRYNACSAGTTAAPMGLAVLGTLIAMAAAIRLISKK